MQSSIRKLLFASIFMFFLLASASAYGYDSRTSYNADRYGSNYQYHESYRDPDYSTSYSYHENTYASYNGYTRRSVSSDYSSEYDPDYHRYDSRYYAPRRYYYEQSTTYSDYYRDPRNRYSDYDTRYGPRRTNDRYNSYYDDYWYDSSPRNYHCDGGWGYCW